MSHQDIDCRSPMMYYIILDAVRSWRTRSKAVLALSSPPPFRGRCIKVFDKAGTALLRDFFPTRPPLNIPLPQCPPSP